MGVGEASGPVAEQDGAAEKDLVEQARDGAPEGTSSVRIADDGALVVEVVVRPAVAMSFLVGVPYAAALGVCEALRELGAAGIGLGWPHDVTSESGTVATVRTQAGYGDGMFVVVTTALDARPVEGVELPDASALGQGVMDGVLAKVGSWAAGIVASGSAATPLGPVLSSYFDELLLMGHEVEIVYPNGRVAGKGTLAGMDVWGRATVRLESGRELEIAPEQAGLRGVDA